MNNVHIFYHTDTDGKAAGYVVRRYCKSAPFYIPDEQLKFHPINYGWRFPFDEIDKTDVVVIVDFSISPEEMKTLSERTEHIIWIDHHISAIEKYQNDEFGKKVLESYAGVRYVGVCGAMLAWIYFRQESCRFTTLSHYLKLQEDPKSSVLDCFTYTSGLIIPESETSNIEDLKSFVEFQKSYAPPVIKFVNDHDVWDYKYDQTADFQAYIRTQKCEPYDDIWDTFLCWDFMETTSMAEGLDRDPAVVSAITKGGIMNEYKMSYEAEYVKRMSFDTVFEGHKCRAVNISLANMSLFDAIRDDSKYDMYITFAFTGNQYLYSLYSSKINVAKIAEKYGGGGHAGAAGFRSCKLLIKIDW